MKLSTKNVTKKLVLTAMFACMAFVLNTFVYFPAMAPFQHFVDVLAAVLVGPWYACASAFLCGLMRMACGRTIQAVTGAVFGPILGGLIYRGTKNIYLVFVGEVVGTGLCGALASYPLMKLFYGLDVQSPFYYIPFYTPAAMVGAGMGVSVLLILKRSGVLGQMQNAIPQPNIAEMGNRWYKPQAGQGKFKVIFDNKDGVASDAAKIRAILTEMESYLKTGKEGDAAASSQSL